MASLRVLSWNVEHFRKPDARVGRVVKVLEQEDPDVIALYEVEGSEVFDALTQAFTTYSFQITEGPQVQEILVGVRGDLSAFFTQKVEFKSGQTTLRPGLLTTVTVDSERFALLFLHTKSGSTPKGLGLRDDMFERAVDFAKVLTKAAKPADVPVNYLFLGDLNTMGMTYTYRPDRNITADVELDKLQKYASKRGMSMLQKNQPHTWWNGGTSLPPSDLDHVVAADHLTFTDQGGGAAVAVRGWPELSGAKQQTWLKQFSDHGYLLFEVSA